MALDSGTGGGGIPLQTGSISIPSIAAPGSTIQSSGVAPVGGAYYALSDYSYFWQYGTLGGGGAISIAGICELSPGNYFYGSNFAIYGNLPPSVYNQYVSSGYTYFQIVAAITTNAAANAASGWCQITTPTSPPGSLVPQFGTVTQTVDGAIVPVLNYDVNYNWTYTTTLGSVTSEPYNSQDASWGEKVTVSGLSSTETATLTVTTQRNGYPDGINSITIVPLGGTQPPTPPPVVEQPPFAIVDPPLPITDANTLASLGNVPGPTANKKFVTPSIEIDQGYKTYLTKFNMEECTQSTAIGIFFNMDKTLTTTEGTVFVELVKYKSAYAQYQEVQDIVKQRSQTWKWSYGLIAYMHPGGTELGRNPEYVYGFADVTLAMDYADTNTPTVLVENPEYISGSSYQASDPTTWKYSKKYDKLVQLKVVHYEEDQSLGNTTSQFPEVLRVFVNNIEVKTWYKLKYSSEDPTVLIKEIISPILPSSSTIPILGKPTIPAVTTDTAFGVYTSQWSQYSWATQFKANKKYNYTYNNYAADQGKPILSEIYATKTALIDSYENYFHGSNRFLTDIAMGKNSLEKSYIMQTNPAAVGLNFYDVQYTTPAATNVAVYPISYLLSYVPSDNGEDQRYAQNLIVNEDALNYSVPINTGFRAKLFIENNSPYLVFLKKEPDSNNTVTVNLNLWTHSILAPSDQQIIESVIDQSNVSEVVQIDSEWIQSARAANKIMEAIASGIDGFSKTIQLQIFGNPLIQIGDIVNFSYSLNGIKDIKYIVKNVSQSYDQGLTTSLTLAKMNV